MSALASSQAVQPYPLQRGVAGMKREKFKRQGNIVQTMQIGNTTIHICDDCIVDTPEKAERVLDDLYAAGWAIIDSLQSNNAEGEKV